MTYPATITSESRNHSRIAAFSCLNKILKVMEERIDPIKKVISWSDGMGAQFRSRFVFILLSTIDQAIYVEWHYNEAHHRKGPLDGVGGTTRNSVFRAVKSGKYSVRDPEEFAKAANDIVPSIRSLYMPIKDMLEEPAEVANGHDFIKMAWDICRTDNVLFCEFLQQTDFITPRTFPNIPLIGQLLLGK